MQDDGMKMAFQEYTQYQPAINERKVEEQRPALADKDERARVLIRVEPSAVRRKSSLLDISLRALAENAEGIISLDLVPEMLKKQLTDLLCYIRRMDVHILDLLDGV
ncbi:Hypothetical predicted protein [Olea europaea subsp. europaea]|uniref:Uncharacterized protein n=1 Tax=Olea europaea subsp. europaea TaxID=158383 RepID=A0A8S0V1N4_OLEEU|nr:Hypothetical predicted protein [Olea europaea subsp. europaea]